MNKRRRILFMAEAVTLAHVARPMVLAEGLGDAFDIDFACDSRFAHLFPDCRLRLHRLDSIPCAQFEAALAAGRPVYDTATLRQYIRNDLELIAHCRPDAIVGDFRLSLAVSATLAQVPYLNLGNAYWSPWARLQFPVPELPLTRMLGAGLGQWIFDRVRPLAFALHARPLNHLRREHGLPAIDGDVRHIYTHGDHVLFADIPELVPTPDHPPHHHYLGAIPWSPRIPLPDWWEDLDTVQPLVYVTLGSSGQSTLLPTVLEALARLPVTVIAATAGRIALGEVPANAHVADYLPGAAAAARARLVICNGGSPTTHQALTAGVPVLGIPNNLDQHLNMQAVTMAGAGSMLRAGQATAATVAAAGAELLDRPGFTEAARDLAGCFQRYDPVARLQQVLDALL